MQIIFFAVSAKCFFAGSAYFDFLLFMYIFQFSPTLTRWNCSDFARKWLFFTH